MATASLDRNQDKSSIDSYTPRAYYNHGQQSSNNEESLSSASFDELLPVLEVTQPSEVPSAHAALQRLIALAQSDPSMPFTMIGKRPGLHKTLTRLALSGLKELFHSSIDALIALDVALSCGDEPGSFLSFGTSSPEIFINEMLIKYPVDFTLSRLMDYPQYDHVILSVLDQRLGSNTLFAQRNAYASAFSLVLRKPHLAVKVMSFQSFRTTSPCLNESASIIDCARKHLSSKGVADLSLFLAQDALLYDLFSRERQNQQRVLLSLAVAVVDEQDWSTIIAYESIEQQSRAILEKGMLPLLDRMVAEGETSEVLFFAMGAKKMVIKYLEGTVAEDESM